MNRKQWSAFLNKAFGRVILDGHSYVDLQLISKSEFPALALLEDLSTEELMILSWLIDLDSLEQRENTCVLIDEVAEVFKSIDCHKDDLIKAMCGLTNRGFVLLSVQDAGVCICTIAENLREKGILTSDFDSIYRASSDDKSELYSQTILN